MSPNESESTTTDRVIRGQVVDAMGDPVGDAGLALAVFDRRWWWEKANQEEALEDLHEYAIIKHLGWTTPVPTIRLDDADSDGKIQLPVRPRKNISTPTILLFAFANGPEGRTWFGAKHFMKNLPWDRRIKIQLNHVHLGRWEYDSGMSAQLWRTVTPSAPSQQTLNIELQGVTDAGILSFELDESIYVDHGDVPKASRRLDPNGLHDRYLNYLTGSVYHHLYQEYVDGSRGLYKTYGEWPIPVYPAFTDWRDVYTQYVQKQFRIEDLPTETVNFIIGALGFAGVPFLGGLAWYFLGLSIASALFDPGEEKPEIRGNQKGKSANLDENDIIPTTWEKPSTAYIHRVPIIENPETTGETQITLRGRWRTYINDKKWYIDGTNHRTSINLGVISPRGRK